MNRAKVIPLFELCYWPSGAYYCTSRCCFYEKEHFCLLAATGDDIPEAFRERVETMTQEEKNTDGLDKALQLMSQGYTQDQIHLVFSVRIFGTT